MQLQNNVAKLQNYAAELSCRRRKVGIDNFLSVVGIVNFLRKVLFNFVCFMMADSTETKMGESSGTTAQTRISEIVSDRIKH